MDITEAEADKFPSSFFLSLPPLSIDIRFPEDSDMSIFFPMENGEKIIDKSSGGGFNHNRRWAAPTIH
jgi:hypothetical protein